jgi:hypothetical protein
MNMSTTMTKMKKATALAVSSAALLLGSISAHAGVAAQCPGVQVGNPQASAVLSNTFATGGNNFSYNFTVCNLSDGDFFGGGDEVQFGDAIRDWELPWDPAADVSNIRTPDGWSWMIETRGVENEATGWAGEIEWQDPDDDFYDPRYANHTQVLHFYTGCGGFQETALLQSSVNDDAVDCRFLRNAWIFPNGDSLSGFGFDAPIGPTNAPYQASWVELPINTGDPDNPGAALTPGFFATPIPEPSSIALMSLALLAAGRRKKSNL